MNYPFKQGRRARIILYIAAVLILLIDIYISSSGESARYVLIMGGLLIFQFIILSAFYKTGRDILDLMPMPILLAAGATYLSFKGELTYVASHWSLLLVITLFFIAIAVEYLIFLFETDVEIKGAK